MKKIVTFVVLYGLSFVVHANTLVVGFYVDDPAAKSACQSNRVEVGGNWCSEYPTSLGDGLYQYSHPGATVDPIDYYDFQFHESGACPDGTEPDSVTGECVEPDDPLECKKEPGESAGHYSWDGVFCVGAPCVKCIGVCEANPANEDGSDYVDLETNEYYQLYKYNGNACEGGTGGGDDPENPDDPDPSPGADGTGNDDPGSSYEEPPDADGDGTPDWNDGDVDGDGIPNSTDDDIDGDGIVNIDDPSPNGGTSDSSGGGSSGGGGAYGNAAHGDSCVQRPSCSGDAVQCAQLFELWRNRCLTTGVELSESGEGLAALNPDDVADEIAAARSELESVLATVRAEADSLLSINLSSGGTIDPNVTAVRGQDVDFSLYKWSSALSIIGLIILAAASIQAAIIVMGR